MVPILIVDCCACLQKTGSRRLGCHFLSHRVLFLALQHFEHRLTRQEIPVAAIHFNDIKPVINQSPRKVCCLSCPTASRTILPIFFCFCLRILASCMFSLYSNYSSKIRLFASKCFATALSTKETSRLTLLSMLALDLSIVFLLLSCSRERCRFLLNCSGSCLILRYFLAASTYFCTRSWTVFRLFWILSNFPIIFWKVVSSSSCSCFTFLSRCVCNACWMVSWSQLSETVFWRERSGSVTLGLLGWDVSWYLVLDGWRPVSGDA